MAARRLQHVSKGLTTNLNEARRLAADANLWTAAVPRVRGMTNARRDLLVELAFLKAFLAWEVFVEESFVLYLYGQSAPKGRTPTRLAFPASLEMAKVWVVPEDKTFASWEDPHKVALKAERFFKDGKPYKPTLKASQSVLREMHKLRNAIAHKSEKAHTTFIDVARNRIGNVPPGLSVGGFLSMNVANSTPPLTFFESYVDRLEFVAASIVQV